MIDGTLKEDLVPYLGGILRKLNGTLIIADGVADHVHLLVVLPQTIAVADAVRTMKAISSGWIHETWPARREFAWQTGYAAFTVSESRRQSVMRYIANQEAHHRHTTFEEEFRKLLERHRIAFDPRFVLD